MTHFGHIIFVLLGLIFGFRFRSQRPCVLFANFKGGYIETMEIPWSSRDNMGGMVVSWYTLVAYGVIIITLKPQRKQRRRKSHEAACLCEKMDAPICRFDLWPHGMLKVPHFHRYGIIHFAMNDLQMTIGMPLCMFRLMTPCEQHYGDLDDFPSLLHLRSLNLRWKLFLCVLILN